jgi:hypothetical protein
MKAPSFPFVDFLEKFEFHEPGAKYTIPEIPGIKSEFISPSGKIIPVFTNEFWTSKQRQSNSIHEVSYRACFKAQLPAFFIDLLTKEGDYVYDPFTGRGTTIIEAALRGRNVASNDINPLSEVLCRSRLNPPTPEELKERLSGIPFKKAKADIDLSMFFHPDTLKEILSLRKYLKERKDSGKEDNIDLWIRTVATNRLTGHSPGFFSVYTLPPNQAASAERQIKINIKTNQIPVYKDTRAIIIKKSRELLKDIHETELKNLKSANKKAIFSINDARYTKGIPDNKIQLTVTSPPFLDVVQYAEDNWLRCWFNSIDSKEVGKNITMSKTIIQWTEVMTDVFKELYRITKPGGYVAFEVGEVRNGKIKLDEHVVEIGLRSGFNCEAMMINSQQFTKTANIWGVNNNSKGTNTNRIVIFRKDV